MLKNKEIDELNLNGWPLPNEYLVEIGRVAAMWAALEGLLNMCLGKLAGFNDIYDPKALIIMKHSSFPQRLDILGALCEQLVGDFNNLKGYKQTIALMRKAQKARNKYMHNAIVSNPSTGRTQMPQMSARGKLKVQIENVEIADIKRATIEIDDAQRSLYKLVLGQNLEPTWKRIDAKNKGK
jgi:hypothetical protein